MIFVYLSRIKDWLFYLLSKISSLTANETSKRLLGAVHPIGSLSKVYTSAGQGSVSQFLKGSALQFQGSASRLLGIVHPERLVQVDTH